MNLLNLIQPDSHDPYSAFDKSLHYRPKLNKGDFFRLTGFDFGWFVIEPLAKFFKDWEGEIVKGAALSYGQKALYYWWYVDAQVTNGGFVQFYYNGYGRYVPVVIKSLQYIGDKKMAELIQDADDIYQKHRAIFESARETDLFGSDLYDQMGELSAFDDDYYKLNKSTMTKIERYIRKNPGEFCLDEDGNEFSMKFTGECKTFHQNNQVRERFNIEKGIITGVFQSFYENGSKFEVIHFAKGEQTGEREEYFENGLLKYSVKRVMDIDQFQHFSYYENGNPRKLEHKRTDKPERIGEYKEWYENGQLAKAGQYISNNSRTGPWVEYYANGQKKMEGLGIDGTFQIHNCWNEQGDQTLKNGTGVYAYDFIGWKDQVEHNVNEYKNYKRHGKQFTYRNGMLCLYQEMSEGKPDGITRDYYKDGQLKSETVYRNGDQVSRQEFPKFADPYVVNTIVCEMKDDWLTNRELETADQYPVPLNAVQIESSFNAPLSLFEGYSQDKEITYTYLVTIDEQGIVRKVDFSIADNSRICDEVEHAIKELTFVPGVKSGVNVNSYSMVTFKFRLADK